MPYNYKKNMKRKKKVKAKQSNVLGEGTAAGKKLKKMYGF